MDKETLAAAFRLWNAEQSDPGVDKYTPEELAQIPPAKLADMQADSLLQYISQVTQ